LHMPDRTPELAVEREERNGNDAKAERKWECRNAATSVTAVGGELNIVDKGGKGGARKTRSEVNPTLSFACHWVRPAVRYRTLPGLWLSSPISSELTQFQANAVVKANPQVKAAV
jgi:hypothetical protein